MTEIRNITESTITAEKKYISHKLTMEEIRSITEAKTTGGSFQ